MSFNGSSDDFCMAVQGLAGVEVFIAKNWALTVDYKFLNLINPEFDAGSTHYKSDVMSQHIVTAGLNFYF